MAKAANLKRRSEIIANGYKVIRDNPRNVVVIEPNGRKATPFRTWGGVSFLDLVKTYKLDQRKAGE